MALYKKITHENGSISNYHRIANIEQNFINAHPVTTVYIYHYADIQYRDVEKTKILDNIDFQNIITTSRHFLETDDSKGATRQEMYIRLMNEIEDFYGSEEV